MSEGLRPIDMNLCGPWISAGVERWNVVDHSWCVYVRNTNELIKFLQKPEEDPRIMQLVTQGGPKGSASIWEELDQRLHNQVASIFNLIEHTRPLTRYYANDAAEMVAEFDARNQRVRKMEQAVFLRELRNYLVHCGHAPLTSTLNFQRSGKSFKANHAFKVNAKAILPRMKWKPQAEKYLLKFPEGDGPVIIDDVIVHAKAMDEVYSWLFEQRGWVVALTPDRFRLAAKSEDEG